MTKILAAGKPKMSVSDRRAYDLNLDSLAEVRSSFVYLSKGANAAAVTSSIH